MAFLLGLLFGLGLIVAQMTNPAKVLAFLDVAGAWDGSLALVMVSALLVLGGTRRFLARPGKLAFSPAQTACGISPAKIDQPLLTGAFIFGTGWGLSGICPGPAIVGLSSGLPGSYAYAAGMLAGFALFKFFHRRHTSR